MQYGVYLFYKFIIIIFKKKKISNETLDISKKYGENL